MSNKVSGVRGIKDTLPKETALWEKIFSAWHKLVSGYCYQQISPGLLENIDLFVRGVGEYTDIVSKEMFTLNDRDDNTLALRPEGTASCVRAAIEHNLIYNQVRRLWYWGPMFRYERPQKGRYRQFHQIGIEVFGLQGESIATEIIAMTYSLWKKLNIEKEITLEINSLGEAAERNVYKEKLVNYLEKYSKDLPEIDAKKIHTNPLRIIDSKNQKTVEILKDAPKLQDFQTDETKKKFDSICDLLNWLKIPFTVNRNIVRGLDYYNDFVFEWTTNKLGAQAAVCAGGRYDGLVEQLGGKQTPAIGCAIGLERLTLLLESLHEEATDAPDIFVVTSNVSHSFSDVIIAERLRDALGHLNLKIINNANNNVSLKSAMRKADKMNAKYTVIVGTEEEKNNSFILKNMRSSKEQQSLSFEQLVNSIENNWRNS